MPLSSTEPRHRIAFTGAPGTAVDIVALDRSGLRADGLMPANPRRYIIFGRSVIAPCAGEVVPALDALPDMAVPRVDPLHLAGNHVILRCVAADILLGHFHQGSVRVRVGERLKIGDAIAQVGNSGNTSEPHGRQAGPPARPVDALFAIVRPVGIRINTCFDGWDNTAWQLTSEPS